MDKVRCELLLTQKEKDKIIEIGKGNLHTGIRILLAIEEIVDRRENE